MFIGLLGPLEVRDGTGAPVHLAGPRLRALLARLALEPGRPVSAEALIDAIWADDPPGGALNALQSLVSRLRRALPPADAARLESVGTGYRLSTVDVDIGRFERLIEQARVAGDPTEARERLDAALALWRGAPLAEVGGVDGVVARLTELRLRAVEDRLELAIDAGDAGLVAELEELVAAHPLRERLRALHMRALLAADRRAEALAAFEAARRALAEELGTDPSPALRDLHTAILRAVPGPPRGNLRAPLTSFVGRDEERVRLAHLLDDARLVTLVGPGGAGKTRLAAEVAGGRAGGAWIVELAGVRDPMEVPTAIFAALDLRETALLPTPPLQPGGGPLDRLVAALGDRPLLMVLDNCEHLIDMCARTADAILGGCPKVRILATSREPLALTGEVLCPVGPLPLPDPAQPAVDPVSALDFPALRLFVDRASAVRPGFALTADNLPSVLEVCRRLDGLPLAIELACARLRTLPVPEIANRLGERFRLLTGGSRAALPRHRTLLGVVEWSWGLFSTPEREVARRLAVFAGDATPESAEAVCTGGAVPAEDVLGLVAGLVDKSFVQLLEAPDGAPRFRMLDTIRAYALDALAEAGEADPVRARHAAYFTDLAERAEPALRTREQLAWLARLRTEYDNLTAALRWAIDSGDGPTAVRLTAALGWFWLLRGSHAEASSWLGEALALPNPAPSAVAYAFDAMHAFALDDFERGQVSAAKARELSVDAPLHPAWAMNDVVTRMQRLDMKGAAARLAELREHPDPWISATAELMSAHAAEHFGDAMRGADHFDAGYRKFKALGDTWGMAMAVSSLGSVYSLAGDHERAVDAAGEAARLAELLGAEDEAARMYGWRGIERLRAGDLAGARTDLLHAQDIGRERGSRFVLVFAETGLADVARHAGDLAAARSLLLGALAKADGVGGLPVQLRAQTLTALAKLEVAAADPDAARERLDEALRTVMPTGDRPIIARVAEAYAMQALAAGDPRAAAEFLGLSAATRGAADHGSLDVRQVESGARTALGDETFAATYAATSALTADAAVAQLVAR